MAQGILLTKQAVAHRLILSAVCMLHRNEDPLVVHLTAASASNLLRELVARRGRNYATRVFAVALFEEASALIEGRKSLSELPANSAVDAAVDVVRREIEQGAITCAEEVDIEMPPSVELQVMRPITAPFNFMKHSDRDADATLDESCLQPIQAIAHAISAYALLFPADALPDEVQEFIETYLQKS